MTAFSMYRGDDEALELTLLDADGVTPLDLTGCSIRFTAKRKDSDTDANAIIAKVTPSEIEIDANPLLGLATVYIVPADTSALTAKTKLLWDVQVTDGAGLVHTVATGTLTILPDITRTS